MFKKIVFSFFLIMMTGCFVIIDDDCDFRHPRYSHVEQDCYYDDEVVSVCDRYGYCWRESRTEYVCEDVYVCHY